MSWNIDRVALGKRKQVGAARNPTLFLGKFDEYAQTKYQEFVQKLKKEKEDVEAEITTLEKEWEQIAPSTSRGTIRRKAILQKRIEEKKVVVKAIEDGSRLEEYKKQLSLYAQAYERELEVGALDRRFKSVSTSCVLPPVEIPIGQTSAKSAAPGFHTTQSGVLQEFMHEVERQPTEVKVNAEDICEECDEVMVMESRTSTLICSCGNWKRYLDSTSSHMAYGEEVEFTIFAYIRINHFNERLTYSQGKESTQINKEDVKKVMDYLIEKRVDNPEKITMQMTYEAMKKLQMRHIYKQNTQLWSLITGKRPPRMQPEYEEKLKAMFLVVNRMWIKYKPEDRKNFLSYNYCLYKFCELLGLDEFLPLYRLLKGDTKLKKQDAIFKKICADPEVNWEFIESKCK